MPIRFTCTTCAKSLRVADDAAGQWVNCPACNSTVQVPLPSPEPEAPAGNIVDAQPIQSAEEPPLALAADQDDDGGERRPCPMCGEMIAVKAAKCRFCGEIFDRDLRRLERRDRRRRGESGNTHSGAGIASFVISMISVVGIIVMFALAIATAGERHNPRRGPNDPGIVLVGLTGCCSAIFSLLGTILGAVGMAADNRKKVYSVIGFVVNLLIVILMIIAMILGNSARAG